MKLVTWNVNSIKQRQARAVALLARHAPDVLCLQELKCTLDQFPAMEFSALGYEAAAHGQVGRNGVAILSRKPLEDIATGFPGDPAPEQSRVVAATVEGVRVICVYVVNGKEVGNADYDLKLRWLDALIEWLTTAHDPSQPLVITGDFNITPEDRDTHDPDAWRGHNLASEPERARVRRLLDWGFVDLVRLHHEGPGPWTYYDYRAGAFHRGWGLRIDHVFGTAPVAERCTGFEVDRNERKPTSGEGKPSDHLPLIVTLDD